MKEQSKKHRLIIFLSIAVVLVAFAQLARGKLHPAKHQPKGEQQKVTHE